MNFMLVVLDLPPGNTLRTRILAREVSISTRPPQATSACNILHARIAEIHDDGAASIMVRLRVGQSQNLLSRITRRSSDQLGLAAGMEVYAQVKSAALM